MLRGRGTKVKRLKKSDLNDSMKDRHVVRLGVEDRESIVLDLGPNPDRDVISKGDRVTIVGKRKQVDDRRMIDASRLSVNGQVLWNSSMNEEPRKMVQR